MGLCKCPKRKVTNLFCFEHRVNVCEHCLVSNHNKVSGCQAGHVTRVWVKHVASHEPCVFEPPQCIVQSYLQWLQDSDYNPNCALCNIPLAEQETVRLVCYGKNLSMRWLYMKCYCILSHKEGDKCVQQKEKMTSFLFLPSIDVFHWACFNSLASRLPLHTAPAGYQCPTCQGPVFPPTNMASPIADVLKDRLSSVNWARAGLGLPLVRPVYTKTAHKRTCSGLSFEYYKHWLYTEKKLLNGLFITLWNEKQQRLEKLLVFVQHFILTPQKVGKTAQKKISKTPKGGVKHSEGTLYIHSSQDKGERRCLVYNKAVWSPFLWHRYKKKTHLKSILTDS